MCGIFGVIAKGGSPHGAKFLEAALKRIALLSESRGKDSSGFAFRRENENQLNVIRSAMPLSKLLEESIIQKEITRVTSAQNNKTPFETFAVMGHARLATNGSQLLDYNNQPVVKEGIVGVHNGIIVNVDDLWDKNPTLKREYDIDTEVLLALVRHHLKTGENSVNAVIKAIDETSGTVSTAFFFNDLDDFILATNNGSLYILSNFKDLLVFASERYMLDSLIRDSCLKDAFNGFIIKQVSAGTGYHLDYGSFSMTCFDLKGTVNIDTKRRDIPLTLKVTDVKSPSGQLSSVIDLDSISRSSVAKSEKDVLEFNIDRIKRLKRCTTCLLPETFPFIQFDDRGVCNYCHNHVPYKPKPLEELKKIAEPFRSESDEPDVIIPYSGGRDSTFTLHMAKKFLGLNPIAYTYDWGMVTDLARRNISRVCGKLGVENIIVSADIRKKRENIRKNINAWLKRPHLGTVPLFMAGDKYFLHYCNQLKKQTGIQLNIWGSNVLEYTYFKTGFAGLHPQFNKKVHYTLTAQNNLRLFKFIGGNILTNPSYLNTSVPDTIGSYIVRYVIPRKDYYRFFDYYQWDEKEIVNLIIKEYDWETAKDTDTTWRIGDGTASFYDYIYYTVAGFSESETFRSNQIREGMITREEGLKYIEKENQPRYDTIRWYLDTVGLDYTGTIQKINKIPKLYK
jgi:glutamine---fructose-6-phosphate transaminase (isomerizing)